MNCLLLLTWLGSLHRDQLLPFHVLHERVIVRESIGALVVPTLANIRETAAEPSV